MKKLFIGLLILIALTLTGCSNGPVNNSTGEITALRNGRFEIVDGSYLLDRMAGSNNNTITALSGSSVTILRDKQTGVLYFYVTFYPATQSGTAAMSPIYDKDGKVMIKP